LQRTRHGCGLGGGDGCVHAHHFQQQRGSGDMQRVLRIGAAAGGDHPYAVAPGAIYLVEEP
jgi:hypothetical protein